MNTGGREQEALLAGMEPAIVRAAAGMARAAVGSRLEAEDLAQEARVAVWQAAARYDAARGVTFSQYAWPRMVGAMRDHARRVGGMRTTGGQGVRRQVEAVAWPVEWGGGEAEEDVPDGQDVAQEVEDRLEAEAVREAVGRLRDVRGRRMLERRMAGWRLADIAAGEGLSLTRTAEVIARAEERVRALLVARGWADGQAVRERVGRGGRRWGKVAKEVGER